jgi:hypothetical protein
MGFIDDKKETINNVALFEVLGNLPKGRNTSSLASVNSKNKNLLPYLTDLLSATCKDSSKNPRDKNKCEATRILIDLLTEFYPVLLKILKEGMVKGIKAGLACGVNFTFPDLTLPTAPKITLKLSAIDFNGLLKVDPLSDMGSMFFGKNATMDLNWFLSDLVQNGGSASWKGILNFNCNLVTQEITISINPNYSGGGISSAPGVNGGKGFDGFLEDFMNSIELMSKEVFMAKLMNQLTGALSRAMAQLGTLSLDQIIAQEKVSALQDKINNSDPCKEDYQYDDSYFKFNNDELLVIEEKANQKFNGNTTLDLGCGIVPATVNPTVVKSLFDEIRNSPPSTSALVIEKTINTLNNNLTANVPNADKAVAKLSLNENFIKELPKIFTNIILEPKIVALYQMLMKVVNDREVPTTTLDVHTGLPSINTLTTLSNIPLDGFDYAKATKVFFEYVTRESLAALLEIIFKKVKAEIIKLVQEQVIKIFKDQSKLKIKLLSSIVTGVVDGILTSIPTPDTSEFV